MAEIIARYADGRLLVKESRPSVNYATGGVPLRIGLVRDVLDVLSVDTSYSRYGLITSLSEVGVSGAQINVLMRRGETGEGVAISGNPLSGVVGAGLMSGISSGIAWLGELADTRILSSVTITACVIGI